MIDLVQNFQHYVDAEYLKQNTAYKLPEGVHIGMYFCLYSGADLVPGDELTQEGIECTLSKEIINVRHMGQYCGFWEMVLAANVINQPLNVVFPSEKAQDLLRAIHNRIFLPQDPNNCNILPLGLMWSKCKRMSEIYNDFLSLMVR